MTVPCPDYMLFDLANDPEETVNVASAHPEVYQRLLQRYEQLKEEEVHTPYYVMVKGCKPYLHGGAWTHGWC